MGRNCAPENLEIPGLVLRTIPDDGIRHCLKHQRLGLLDLRQRLHLGEHGRRHGAVDLDQRDGVAALLDAAEMEGRDVGLGVIDAASEDGGSALMTGLCEKTRSNISTARRWQTLISRAGVSIC